MAPPSRGTAFMIQPTPPWPANLATAGESFCLADTPHGRAIARRFPRRTVAQSPLSKGFHKTCVFTDLVWNQAAFLT
ncbi:hypothetical protein B7486_05520 [cyanobacterium TDX16]|nr:hypothetical protein B7486_05520 [cyanobacterium TDX16]